MASRRRGPRRVPSALKASTRPRHALVLVLGDVGRSPRMQYHALSLSRSDSALKVSLAGCEGERCVPELLKQQNVEILTFPASTTRFMPLKVIFQAFQLLWLLLVTAGPVDLVLLQNPPT